MICIKAFAGVVDAVGRRHSCIGTYRCTRASSARACSNRRRHRIEDAVNFIG